MSAADGFASNVVLLSQFEPEPIDQYVATTQQGIQKAGLKCIRAEKTDPVTAFFEYSGDVQGRTLHVYLKASFKDNQILTATATALEKQWPKDSAQLKACVDSFSRDAAQ